MLLTSSLFSICEISVTYSTKIKAANRPKIAGSRDCYELVLPLWDDLEYRESFCVLLMSRANRVLGISQVSMGGVSGTVADPKVIFQHALKANASSLIMSFAAVPADCKINPKDEIFNPITSVMNDEMTVEEWAQNVEAAFAQVRADMEAAN